MKQKIISEWKLFITSDKQKLFYFIHKNHFHSTKPQPVVVLCNGIGSSNKAWKYVVEELKNSFTIIQIAYRGTIEYSSGMDLTLTRHAKDIYELTRQINVDVYGIIGWSMGVQVALHLSTMLHPKTMVLLCGAQNKATSRVLDSRFLWSLLKPVVVVGTKQGEWLLQIGKIASKSRTFRSVFVHLGTQLGLMGSDLNHNHFVSLLEEWFELDLRVVSKQLLELDSDVGVATSDLSYVSSYALVIIGHQDVLVHRSLSQKLSNALLKSTIWTLPSSGHFVLLENRKIERKIKTWLLERYANSQS